MNTVQDAAKSIIQTMKFAYQEPFTIKDVNESDFLHLNLNSYRNFKDLQSKEYQYLGDIEILEISNSPGTMLARTMIRLMLSPDGCTYVSYYQVKPRIWRLLRILLIGILNLRVIAAPRFFIASFSTKHCYELGSEFENGSFVTTSNVHVAGLLQQPSVINSKYFDYDTSLEDLISEHTKRLKDAASNESVSPIRINNKKELLLMQERLKKLKDAHRATLQWISKEELHSLSGGDTVLADEVFKEVEKLLGQPKNDGKNSVSS